LTLACALAASAAEALPPATPATTPTNPFFTATDREGIRAAARTDWGRPIVAALEAACAERLRHDLAVPRQEAGHFHHYFCPEHKGLLRFDWDRPRAHWCPGCQKHLTGSRYDFAWVRMLHGHNQTFLRNATWLQIIHSNETHHAVVRRLLLEYAERYPQYRIHGHDMQPDAPYGGRMFSQSLDEATWIVDVAPAFAEARPRLTAEEARRIEDNLLRPCAAVIQRNRTGGNWQVWHNAGLACIAVALDDKALLDAALHDPKHGYWQMLRTGLTTEGWWMERSPGYHFYPLHAMLLTAEAVRPQGIQLYEKRLLQMFLGPLRAVYADLRFPAHNDGWYGLSLTDQAPLYEIAARRFDAPELGRLLAHVYARTARRSPWALLHGADIKPSNAPWRIGSVIYPDTGVALLRSGPRTVVLKYGPHGGGHGHPDKLSISLHNGQRELLTDMGTPGYGVPDYTAWYKRTLAHSTVVVDQRDQAETTGELVKFTPAPDGGVVEARCTTAYPGVELVRRLHLNGRRLEDRFDARAAEPRLWDYVLILTVRPPVPAEAKPARLEGGPPYSRLREVRSWTAGARVDFDLPGARLELQLPAGCEVFTGIAPGIPDNPWIAGLAGPDCYPLLVRQRAKSLTIEARWDIAAE
jgi:hypothetical protein